MATFYIQLENKLLQISGELTAENVSKALGYVPVSPNVTTELSQRVDNITFDSLKDNPFLQDGSGELNIVDESGNIIAKVNSEGFHSVDFIAGEHKLSEKANKTYVDTAVKNVEVDLTGYATEEYVNNIDFYNIKDNPIVNNGDDKLLFVDENGYIGLQLEEDGLYVKDVIADGHTLSQKADKSDIPSLDGYATESYVNTNLQNYATKDEVSDLVDMSIVEELQGKVNTLVGEDSAKSVRNIANEELAALLLAGNDNLQSLLELAAWIDEHPEDASAMNEAIQSNTSNITKLDTAYKEADVKVLTDANEYTDNINFYTIKDNPIVNGEAGSLTFVDETGYIGLKVTEDGIIAKDVVTPEHKLSDKANTSDIPTKVSQLQNDANYITTADIPNIPSLDEYVTETELSEKGYLTEHQDISHLAEKSEIPSLDGYATEQWVEDKNYLTEHQDIAHLASKEELNNIDFYSIQNNPVVNTEEGKLLFVDESGNIGLQLEADNTLYVKDVVGNGHILSSKQDTLISGTTIKTINGESILGEGNLTVNTEANIQTVTRLGYEEFEERPARDAIDLTTGEKVYFYGDAAYIGVSYTGRMLLDYIDDKVNPMRIIKWDVEPTPSVEIPEEVSNWVYTQEGILILNGGIAIIVPDNDLLYIQSCITKGDNIVITKVYSYQFTDREEILIESYPINSGGSGGSITVDTSMSSTSTNPVQNKVIKSYIDSNCNIPTETTTASSKSLTANKYCRWTNTPTSITITLATPSNTSIVNNYMFEFTASSSGCTLSVPSTIKWVNGTVPSIEAGKTYQISIINNLATVAKFS